MKAAISTTSFGVYSREPLEVLQNAGLTPILNPHGRKLKPDETVELCSEAVGLIAGTEALNWDVLKALPSLKVISRCGVGMDNVDLAAAKELGIQVKNTPEGPTRAVAELTVGYILNLLRLIGRMDRDIRTGVWKKHMGWLLQGKQVGVLGYGRIGQAVAKLLTLLGAKVSYCDPVVDLTTHPRCSFEELLSWSEILTLHCSMPPGSCLKLGAAELDSLPEGAFVVNASRGGLVDEKALYDRLKSGRIAGAALDVFEKEPYQGPLAELENVILTPHIGSYAREARIRMEMDAALNLLEGLGLAASARGGK